MGQTGRGKRTEYFAGHRLFGGVSGFPQNGCPRWLMLHYMYTCLSTHHCMRVRNLYTSTEACPPQRTVIRVPSAWNQRQFNQSNMLQETAPPHTPLSSIFFFFFLAGQRETRVQRLDPHNYVGPWFNAPWNRKPSHAVTHSGE